MNTSKIGLQSFCIPKGETYRYAEVVLAAHFFTSNWKKFIEAHKFQQLWMQRNKQELEALNLHTHWLKIIQIEIFTLNLNIDDKWITKWMMNNDKRMQLIEINEQ